VERLEDVMLDVGERPPERLKRRWSFPAAVVLATGSLGVSGLLPGIAVIGLCAAAVVLAAFVPEAKTQSVVARAAVPVMDPNLARWQIMLDGMHTPSLVLDRGDIVIGANALADSTLPNAKGHAISAVCRAPELLDAIAAAHKTGAQQPCHIAKLSLHHGAAVAIVTPLVAQPSANEAALLIAIRDLAEQEKLSRMRSDFVANASHELRTPLTSLKGFIETLRGPAKNDAVARERFLGIMHEQADRMSRLIDDLLSLSRVEMKQHVRPTEHVNLLPLLADVMREITPVAELAGITLVPAELHQIGHSTLFVVGDRDELRLVLQNLLQNAIKYGRRGGYVALKTVLTDGGRIAIEVRDNGIGIEVAHIPRLTERFYRVTTGEGRGRDGTGLGLAIVKHIVNRHRGELLIESELNVGSTFTVTLPLAP
jgi:two-component system, OmpR family, phosphate regulon sensor histidine kinase PhoR